MFNKTIGNKNRIHWVTKSFLIVFFIVLFEGALRKWLNFPSLALMALRDLIIFGSVLYGFKYFNFRRFPEVILMLWTFIVLIWTLFQGVLEMIPAPVIVIGIRFWLLYLWFAVLCYRTFRSHDLKTIINVLYITIFPMITLVVMQHLSPVDSFINQQPPGGGEIFIVIAGIVRPSGTFSFTIGYTTYLAMIGPFVLWLLADGRNFIQNYYYRLIIIGAYFLGVLVSGSRGAIMLSLFLLFVYFISLIITKQFKLSKKTVILAPIIIGVSLYLLAPIIERAFDANLSRIEDASQVENTSNRIFDTFVGANKTWENFKILGHGIGAGSNAAQKFMPNQEMFALGENEIDRILNEGGIIGAFFEVFKIIVSISSLFISLKLLLFRKFTLPILVWSYMTIQLLTATTTGQITVNAFTFLSLGLSWYILKYYKERS